MNAPRAIALCQCFNGALEFQAGHWAEAEQSLRESIQLYRQIGAASGEALAWQRLGVLQTARGRLDEAMTSLQEGISVAERAVMRAHCLARLYATMARNRLMAGDVEAAAHYLSPGLAMSERHGQCTTCDALLLPVAVSVHIAQGNLPLAETYCQLLEETADKYVSQVWMAMARQTRGELAAARGDLDNALACYSQAQAALTAAGNQYEAAHCMTAMADLRRARNAPGDAEAARAAQLEAKQIFERLRAI
jgi:predicted negative regulator of RcsB-dependent stress response